MPVKREANSEEKQIPMTQKAEQEEEVLYPKVLEVDDFEQFLSASTGNTVVTTSKNIIDSNKARKRRRK
jgi:ribosomal protein S8